jgi:pimeloyl-ACP methyl ester carboxylesterase
MDIHEFGKEKSTKIMLIPGNMMSWRQFRDVISLLAETCHVIAVSTDGYDDTGRTTFTTAHESAAQLAAYIDEHLGGSIDLVFGESFGSATAMALFHDFKGKAKSMILSGPQYFNFGPLNRVFKWYIPKNQYKLCSKVRYMKKAPLLLKLFTGNDEETLNGMFFGMAENISIETLRNTMDEAFNLYRECSGYYPEPNAHVGVWYGEKELNMKRAVCAIRQIYPYAEIREFKGFGHGEIMLHPELMVEEIREFLNRYQPHMHSGL